MSKKILIDALYPGETRVVIHDKNRIQDFDYENSHKKQLKGNIYLARITRVEPSLQAAFIEYGGDRHGFLPFNEIHPNYFIQSPIDKNFETETLGAVLAEKISAINLPDINEVEEEEHVIVTEQEEESFENTDEDEKNFNTVAEDEFTNESEIVEKASTIHQKLRIQDVLTKGQLILIQIIKEERGNKGAACTSYISLAGRYCVLMPNSNKQGGISRRIINPNDRKRLKNVLAALSLPEGVGIILRTAGAEKNITDIKRDYFYLARLWNAIREHTLKSNVNSFIHAESDLIKRTIRDLYSSEISEIQIQGIEAFKQAKDFIKKILPLHANKVKEYKAKTPIFTKYNIEDQINALYTPISNLPSGGYIVINPTEALIAIDVNSGKSNNEINIEETATKTNVEAAVEIARQLKLRDMSGLIVIDFIDMEENNNRRLVERTLRDALQSDRSKVQIGNISSFGLLELSRQRLQSSFMELNTVKCPACNGKGHIKSFETNALVILRTIESEIFKCDSSTLNVYAHPEIIIHLVNHKRLQLNRLETTYKCKIMFHKENTVYYDGFALEKIVKNNDKVDAGPKFKDDDYIESYGQEFLDEEIEQQEDKLGLGKNLAPYQVNSDVVIEENNSTFNKNNRNNNNYRKNNHKRRKISNATTSDPLKSEDDDRQPPFSEHKPALIFQPGEDVNKPQKHNNKFRNRNGKFNNYRDGRNPNRPIPEKKSIIKSWWDRLIE